MENKREWPKLSNYLWYTSTTLRIVGLWKFSDNDSKLNNNNGVARILYFFRFIIVASLMISQSCQMMYGCWINYTNFETAAESIGPMMGILTSFGKMCIYRRNREILNRLMESLVNCLNDGPDEVRDHLENYVKLGYWAIGSWLGMTWLLTVAYLSVPAISRVAILPFASWYPFDYENSMIFYCVAYIHEIVLTCFACCVMSTEITFVLSILHCCARYKVLRTRLETMANDHDDDDNDDDRQTSDGTYRRSKIGIKLSSIVKLHSQIFRDVEDINNAYTYIAMGLFFAAVIAICCTGLQVTSGSPESSSTIVLFFGLSIFYAEQLLFYYLPGEILAEQAIGVSESAYDSGWESFERTDKRTIGLMIMRSYVPPKLLVGQLSPLRLENYRAFLTTTGSYFTSIRAVADA